MGLDEECQATLKVLREAFDVISVRGPYGNRNSREVRYFVEVRVR
jgi:hypothetical protein